MIVKIAAGLLLLIVAAVLVLLFYDVPEVP